MPDTKRDFYNVCPDCWSVRVKLRIFKSPRYVCQVCGLEFENKKRLSYPDRILFNDILKIARKDLEQIVKTVNISRLRKSTVKTIKGYLNA